MGFSKICTSHNNNLLAATEYGLNPKCYIYQMPQKRVIKQFEVQTTFVVEDMTFSRDGKYLLIVGGVPDFRLSIFDLENNQILPMTESILPCAKEDLISVAFNPKTKTQFSILSKHVLYFCKLLPAFLPIQKKAHDGEVFEELDDAWRLETSEFSVGDIPIIDPDHSDPIVMVSLKWDSFGRVQLCTNTNQLLQVCAENPCVEQSLPLPAKPLTTLLTHKHMIVSLDNGMVEWYLVDPPPLDNKETTLQKIQEEVG